MNYDLYDTEPEACPNGHSFRYAAGFGKCMNCGAEDDESFFGYDHTEAQGGRA